MAEVKCKFDEMVELHKIVAHKNNANTHPDRQVELLAKNIDFQGWRLPIIVSNLSGMVVAGHGRMAAAEKLNEKMVPVVYQDFENEAQEYAFLISENKLSELAKHDDAKMIEDLKLMDLDDFELLGLDDFDLPTEPDPAKEEIEDDVPTDVETRCKPGDLWILGEHRLLCGDSTNIQHVERLMGGEKADMVFTDPPYGIDVVQSNSVGGGGPTKFGTVGSGKIVKAKTYRKICGDESTDVAKDFYNLCESMGFKNIVLWGGNYFTDFLYPSRCWIIWDKEMTGNFSQAEMAWTSFSTGGIKVFKFLWNGLSRKGNRKDELKARVHPTQKPVGLFQQIFERLDKIEKIFDGFGGSGSTLIACEKTNRKCFMMELDPHYCDVILSRWEKYSGKEAKLEQSRQTEN